MDKKMLPFSNVDEYIAQFPAEVQQRLHALRQAIREMAPDAREKISWDMPTFDYHGNVVHFAAFKSHISLFPGADGVAAFLPRLEGEGYKLAKGTIQFPANKPLPLDLVREIVAFRVAQNVQWAEEKKTQKKRPAANADKA